ncbi:MAG: DNA polymerase III subunit gamma/tau [Patescibacteria group bacterium]|nr:DNA polymerase III subunit gamma/tau [Patescibacteria group bacterium]
MIAIYRKYRPKLLEDVLGQESITAIIKNQAKADNLAHAYLFYGSRGAGKTTTARLIAKIANCQTRQTDSEFQKQGEPCNKCQTCQEIDNNQALDVIEIDAASNRGIDEIRDLKEGIKLSPSSYKYKIFIIDEVHQLTKEAFNALLKTLEEPPRHAILILATTEYEKVPATIASRAQKFHFKKIPLKEIADKLKKICEIEKIKYASDALELIAASADGSFRDAESLLDQIANLEGKIEVENVEKILGRVSSSRVSKLADLIIKKDLENTLEYINKINEEGYNILQLNKELIHYFRKVLTLKFSPVLEKDFSQILTETELAAVKKHSKEMDAQKTINLVKSLIRAYTEMRYSPFVTVPLEVTIIENLKNTDKL